MAGPVQSLARGHGIIAAAVPSATAGGLGRVSQGSAVLLSVIAFLNWV